MRFYFAANVGSYT